MKIKTLKNLKTDSADLFCKAVSYNKLRQEVIKQIKDGTFDPFNFFNITLEDLQ